MHLVMCLTPLDRVANSVASDQTPLSAVSDQGLHDLLGSVCRVLNRNTVNKHAIVKIQKWTVL